MASVSQASFSPRYGSPAELASYAGVSVKTVRRLVDAGKVRGRKLGRRVLIPFADLDDLWNRADGPGRPSMQATPPPPPMMGEARPFVPPMAASELARRNAAAVAFLDEMEADAGSEQDQREAMDVLRQALGPDRVGSSRPALP